MDTICMELSEAAFLHKAEQICGLSDWGSDPTFRIGLGILVEALRESEPLPQTVVRFTAQMIDLLVTRLRLEDDARFLHRARALHQAVHRQESTSKAWPPSVQCGGLRV